MNALAGWGFLPGADLARAVNPAPKDASERARVFAKGRYVTRAELTRYADGLRKAPSNADVMTHFRCSRAAAYRYRTIVIALIAERGRT